MAVKYAIDGLFLTQTVTGIQRVAYEVIRSLDRIVGKDELLLLTPNKELNDIKLQNIEIIKYGKLNGIPWQQIEYSAFLRKNNLKALCLTNTLPLTHKHGIIMIHDVNYKANPQFFTSIRDRASALWHNINYYFAAHSKMHIVTVSEYSKSEIKKYYRVPEERITVSYNGWQHMESIVASKDTFKRYPMLRSGHYYFSMASLAPNKNFKWIVEAAKLHPEETFAIAGGGNMKNENLDNLHLLGYVSDEDAKTLMENCKAFLFPTFYEGFGLPPLEAIACGAKEIIVSDTPCMREVYGASASYINPDSPGKWIIDKASTKKEILLKKYSWDSSANIIRELL